MKIISQLLSVAALLLIAGLLGCQTTRPDIPIQVPIAETSQDQALSKSVREKLSADKKLDLTAVNVVSNSGTVYLTGTVKSLDARQQAVKTAWEVRGVQSVVNSLEVEK
jgi:osmotically-inducible protein OsmY